jgi:hypothetical protein
MKIYLTEFIVNNETYAGPNIVAKDFDSAEFAALENGLTIVGELNSLYVDKTIKKAKSKNNVIPFPKPKTLH